jgi:pimeloyl-ACP methyl ester carboxylesterase
VHLLGHSFGSVIAAMLAAADHDTFASLTLVEPILPEDATSVAPADALRRHLSDLFHVETPAHHATLDAVAQRLRLGFTALPVEASQALAARIADPTPDGQVCPTLEHSGARLVAALRDIDRARYQALLATLDLPLLWLRGSHSPHRRARDDAALHASLRTARLQELDGGHNLHLDASNALSDALLAFFAPPSNAGNTQGHRATPVIEMVR